MSVDAPKQSPASTTDVPVKLDLNATGSTVTAALSSRGGQSKSQAPNSDAGQVALRYSTKKSSVPATTKAPTKAPAKAPVKKKVTKRASITGIGETNSTSGLTGGTGDGTDTGEQAPTPSSDAP